MNVSTLGNPSKSLATAPLGKLGILWSGLLALAVVVSQPAAAKPVASCICVKRTLCEKVHDADVVFEAMPLDKSVVAGQATFRVTVGAVYKGVVSPGVVVQSKASLSACGVDLQPHTPYLVFGTIISSRTITTNGCSGTAPKAEFSAADIQQITQCAVKARTSGTAPDAAAKTSCTGVRPVRQHRFTQPIQAALVS